MTTLRAALRDNTVALLIAAGTRAGRRVEACRDTEIADTETPFIAVYTDAEVKMLASEAGTDTLFDCTITLHLDLRATGTTTAGASAELEGLIDQTLAALLTAPAFWFPQADGSRLVRRVSRVTIASAMRMENLHVALAQLAFDIEYSDLYPTVIPDTLATVAITEQPNLATPPPPSSPPPATVTVTIAPT